MALVLLGLIVGAAGLGIVTDDCVVACGTDSDKRFRAGCGYFALACGAGAIASALIAPRKAGWLTALACVIAGAVACLAAFIEGLSHLS